MPHLCGGLTIGVRQKHNALVYLDAGDDPLALEQVDEGLAIRSVLV